MQENEEDATPITFGALSPDPETIEDQETPLASLTPSKKFSNQHPLDIIPVFKKTGNFGCKTTEGRRRK